jgi:hypothetical protein
VNDERRAWVLNLDAEHELETGAGYAPTKHLRAIVARERLRLLGNLVRPGDVVITEDEARPGIASGLRGVCWSPTPRALGLLATAGAVADPAPAFEHLRAVNARAFAARVRAPLARSSFDKSVAATLEQALASLSAPTAAGWLVRRSYGAAGRGRRRLAAGRPTEEELRWLAASLRRGALVIEPWVEVTREYTRNGWVHADGRVDVLAPGLQETTRTGAWLRTEAAHPDDVGPDDARLTEATAAAGAALAATGYFGPFGVDAFRHRSLSSRGPREVLNPLSEINARYTMDWSG